MTEKISFFREKEGKTKPKWKLTKDNGNEEHELELSPNMLRFLGLRNENENKRRHMHALHSSWSEVHCSKEKKRTRHDTRQDCLARDF